MMKPNDVVQQADGTFTLNGLRVCEDCWYFIPRYVDFPRGLVSPESDGDQGGNGAKTRPMAVSDKMGIEHMPKVVCLGCYRAAFSRVYPGAALPELRSVVVGAPEVVPNTAVADSFVEAVRV